MIKIFFPLFILTLKIQAQVVLVPAKDMSLVNYLQKCKLEGYQCTQDYFKHLLTQKKSEVFEQFIETLDLYSEDYRRLLPIKIKALLNSENLNLEQVDLLIKVITKFETIDKNSVLSQIKNELKELSFDVQNIFEEKTDSEIYVLFNKYLTKKQYLNLKYKQKYTKTMKITPFIEPMNADESQSVFLVQGNCESYTLSPLLQTLKTTTLFEDECGNSKSYSDQSSTSNFKWKDYEKPFLYTVGAVVLIGFLSQYQVELTY